MVEGRLVAVDTPEGLRRQALGGEVIILSANDRIDINAPNCSISCPL